MRVCSRLVMTALALSSGAGVAHAQTTVFAGATLGEDQSAYLGAQRRLATESAGGWSVRGGVSAGRYDYDANGVGIDGSFMQVQALVLREWFKGPAYAAVGVGPRFAETRLKPDDPGNEREGGRFDGVVTAEAAWNGELWRANAYAEYGIDQSAFYTRLVATRRLAGPWRAGVEALAEGDRTYDRLGGGLVLAHGAASSREIRVSIGAMDRDGGSGAYAAVAWVRSF